MPQQTTTSMMMAVSLQYMPVLIPQQYVHPLYCGIFLFVSITILGGLDIGASQKFSAVRYDVDVAPSAISKLYSHV